MSQMDLTCQYAAVQVSGCSECLSFLLMLEGSGDNICLRCEQVDNLLSLMAKLKEELKRSGSIREFEKRSSLNCNRCGLVKDLQ